MAPHQFSFALERVDYLHCGDEPRTCPQKVAKEAGSLTSDYAWIWIQLALSMRKPPRHGVFVACLLCVSRGSDD